MILTHFNSLYLVLIILVLTKISFNRSGLSTFLTVLLGCCVSFCFFESLFSFLPLVSFCLKEYVVSLFMWLKITFYDLKRFILFGQAEKNSVNGLPAVLMMGENEKETISSPPRSDPLQSIEPQSSTSGTPFIAIKEDGVYVYFPAPSQGVLAVIKTIADTFIAHLTLGRYFYVVLRVIIPACLTHLDNCRDTVRKGRYARGNVFGIGFLILASFYITKPVGNKLSELIKKRVETLLSQPTPVIFQKKKTRLKRRKKRLRRC